MKIKKGKDKSYAKHYASYQPSYISAFIRSQPLQKSVKYQRNHHCQNNSKMGTFQKNTNRDTCDDADKFSRAARTDWKLSSPEIKRAIRPGVAAKENLQESSESRMLQEQVLPHP